MSNKKPIFIDLDRAIVATWEGKVEDESTTEGEVKIEYTPFGRWLPFSLPFTKGTVTTQKTVDQKHIRSFEPTWKALPGQQRSIKVVIRPEDKFSSLISSEDQERIQELEEQLQKKERDLRKAEGKQKDKNNKNTGQQRRGPGHRVP